MSSRLCRRSLVAGVATLPALTVPAGATAIAPTVFADIGHTVGDRSRAAWVTRAQIAQPRLPSSSGSLAEAHVLLDHSPTRSPRRRRQGGFAERDAQRLGGCEIDH
jgi:hypothetical protein